MPIARFAVVFVILAVFFYACNNRPRVHDATEGIDSTYGETEYDDERGPDFDYSKTSMSFHFVNYVNHTFSEVGADDKFSFCVPKGNINETKSVLIIQNPVGDTIFADTVLTSFLIDKSDLGYIYSDGAMEDYIISRAKMVLDSSKFYSAEDTGKANIFKLDLDKDKFDDYETLVEIKEENRHVFFLTILEKDVAYFGYSRRQKGVKVIYSSL